MNVLAVAQIHTHVCHAFGLGIAKEEQVARLCLVPVVELEAGKCLLGCVSLQYDAVSEIAYFHESRAVGDLGRGSAPQVA